MASAAPTPAPPRHASTFDTGDEEGGDDDGGGAAFAQPRGGTPTGGGGRARLTPMAVGSEHSSRAGAGQSGPLRWLTCGARGRLAAGAFLVVLVAVALLGGLVRPPSDPEAPSPRPLDPTTVASALAARVSDSGSVHLLAIGDWGREGMYNQTELGVVLGDAAAALAPHVPGIFSVGDAFYTDGVLNESDPLWERSWRSVYTHPALASLPWWTIAGNHDYRGNVSAQVGWTRDARWRFPALNYTLTWARESRVCARAPAPRTTRSPRRPYHRCAVPGGGDGPRACVRGIFIDTVPFIARYRVDPESEWMRRNLNASDPVGQVAWLAAQLDAADAECVATLVFGHHPVYSGGLHGDSVDMLRLVKPLLDQHRVDAYIAGHDHTLIHLQETDTADSVQYVVTGAGSRVRSETHSTPQTVWYRDTQGFTVHSVNATHVRHTFLGLGGATLHATTRPLRRAR